jgi:hypothetical protein
MFSRADSRVRRFMKSDVSKTGCLHHQGRLAVSDFALNIFYMHSYLAQYCAYTGRSVCKELTNVLSWPCFHVFTARYVGNPRINWEFLPSNRPKSFAFHVTLFHKVPHILGSVKFNRNLTSTNLMRKNHRKGLNENTQYRSLTVVVTQLKKLLISS